MSIVVSSNNNWRVHRKLYLAEWAEKRGLKQVDVARGINVEKSMVSKWFNGTVFPKPENLDALAAVFELDDVYKLFIHPDRSDDWMNRLVSDARIRRAFQETLSGRSDEEIDRMLRTLETAFPRS